jgi:hypothetical protein
MPIPAIAEKAHIFVGVTNKPYGFLDNSFTIYPKYIIC